MEERTKNIKKILASACDVFDVEMSEVRSKSRMRNMVDSRKAIAYLLAKYFHMKPGNISMEISKNHCVIRYMIREAETLLRNDTQFKIKVERIRAANGLDERLCPCCGRPYIDSK